MSFVHIAGRLGADPEVRFTQSGKKVTTLRVAARRRKGPNNEETLWWRVTVWEDDFAPLMPHFKKGDAIMVYGEMHKPEIFTGKDGTPQVSLEVTAIDIRFSPFGKTAGESAASAGKGPSHGAPPFGAHPQGDAMNPYVPQGAGSFDEEIPF